MSGKLESTVNVATLVTCLAVLGTIGQQAFVSKQGQLQPPKVFREGDRLPTFEGLDLRHSEATLVMVLRHDCRFCAASVPFYQTLRSATSRLTGGATQIALLTSDDADTAAQFVHNSQVEFDQIVSLRPEQYRDLRIPGTPTLILVDSSGQIRHVWVGLLDQAHQAEVRTALATAATYRDRRAISE